MRENGSHSHTAIGEENNEQWGKPRQVMANIVEDYVEESERKWKKGSKTMDHTLYGGYKMSCTPCGRHYNEWIAFQYRQSKVHVQVLHRNHIKQQALYQGISIKIEWILFGDDGDKDEDYLMNCNKQMEHRHLLFL